MVVITPLTEIRKITNKPKFTIPATLGIKSLNVFPEGHPFPFQKTETDFRSEPVQTGFLADNSKQVSPCFTLDSF